MSRSEKDAVGGHNPHRPGFEWQSKRSTFLFNDPGKEAKQRASSVHHMRDNDAEFMRFERVKKPRSRRPDLHGMLLLDELQPGEMDIISAAEHDEFWLDIDVDSLSAVITHDQCVELQRCGIRYDEGRDSLAVFT